MNVCANPNCNDLFEPCKSWQKYCSSKCVNEAKAERGRQKHEDPAYRELRKKRYRQRLATDPAYRELRKNRYWHAVAADPEYRERKNERARQRYGDPAQRERKNDLERRRRANPEVAAKRRAYGREYHPKIRDLIIACEKQGILTLGDFA